jgi:cytochrome P450
MSETPTPGGPVPEYPMRRDARCPFAPAATVREMTREEPVGKVRIWDGSTPWFITRHADQRALLNDPRLSVDEKRPGYPHMTRSRAASAPHHPALITNTDPPEHTRLRRTVNARSWSSGSRRCGRASRRSSTP